MPFDAEKAREKALKVQQSRIKTKPTPLELGNELIQRCLKEIAESSSRGDTHCFLQRKSILEPWYTASYPQNEPTRTGLRAWLFGEGKIGPSEFKEITKAWRKNEDNLADFMKMAISELRTNGFKVELGYWDSFLYDGPVLELSWD